MKIHSKLLSGLLFTTLALGAVVGCGGDQTANSFQPSTGGGGTGDGEQAGDQVGFYIEYDPAIDEYTETKLHKFGDFNSQCMVPATATTGQDLNCMLNIREEDLFFAGLKMQVNFPQSMCPYLVQRPFWYYKAAPGFGPRVAAWTIDEDQGKVTACTADGVAGTANADGTCDLVEGSFASDGAFTCAYTHQVSATETIDCCMGPYTGTITTIRAGTATVSTTTGFYPGKFGNCIESLGDDLEVPRSNYYGYPGSLHTHSNDVQATFELPRPIEKGALDNYKWANFYGWSDYAAGTWATAATPDALSYMLDLSGSTVTSPNKAWVFECADRSLETKHRINLYINEWDTNEDFVGYSAAGSTAYSPDKAYDDIEGTDCATTGVPGGLCDDFWDWQQIKDMGLEYPPIDD